MPHVFLRHAQSGAVISVEAPPTGISVEYARAGWQEFTPPPEPDDEAPEPPAEPVNPEPATEPVDKPKE